MRPRARRKIQRGRRRSDAPCSESNSQRKADPGDQSFIGRHYSGLIIRACCTSLIMSPSGLVRNVPYTVTSRGGPVEEDSDEHEGTSAGRGNGAGEEQDAAVDRCGKDTGVELPADEETLEAVSRGRSEGSAAPQCGKRFEPCEAGRVPAEGCAADPEEVFGNGAGALWTDAGSGALSG